MLLLWLAAWIMTATAVHAEMNGPYMLSDYLNASHVPAGPASHRGSYIDVYSFNISTRYSEVYWTMQPPIPLPAHFKARSSAHYSLSIR